MDIDYLLTSTRSARKSLDLDAPVDPGDLRECLRIACQAANGSNQQSWRWLVVLEPGLRAQVAGLYREARLSMGPMRGEGPPPKSPFGRMMSSTDWLVEHLAEVPAFVIPCYEPYMENWGGAEADSFHTATVYGSIFPAVWNFQLALHTRGYGTCITTLHLLREREVREVLGIPDTYVQGCLLPVGRLRPGTTFHPAPRRPIEEVVAVDGWDGPSL